MVKGRGKAGRASAALRKPAVATESSGNGPPVASRPAQAAKRHKKRKEFLKKIALNQPAVRLKDGGIKKKQRKPGKPLPDLSALAASLEEVATKPGQPRKAKGQSVGTLKQRAALVVQESARLQAVLQHPQFQQDPLKAITMHLNATLAPRTAIADAPKSRDQHGKQDRKEKKRRRKAMLRLGAMDM